MLQSLTSWQDRLNPLAEVEFSSQSREIKSGKGGVRKTLSVWKKLIIVIKTLLQNYCRTNPTDQGGRQVTNERLGKCQLPPGAWSQWSVVTHNV